MLSAIALLFSPQADVCADRAALLAGVEALEAVGVPGPVVVLGPDAFAVLTDERGEAVVAAARWGKGRVVAFGHGGYLGEAPAETGRGRLLANAIAWAARGSEAPGVAALRAGARLEGVDVLTWDGADVSAATEEEVRAFVRSGGGLVVGSCPWGWQQLHPRLALREDAPANRVLAPMGLVFGPTYLAGPFPASASRPDEAQAGEALRELATTGSTACLAVLERALQSAPSGDALFLPAVARLLADRSQLAPPSEERPLHGADALARLQVAWWTRKWEDASIGAIAAAPGAEHFPGAVPAGAPRVATTLELQEIVPGWISTGAYAAPGEKVHARALKGTAMGWALRIGAHTDSLAQHDVWRRWPSVSRRFEFEEQETVVASPFGGLIYLEAERGARAPLHLELTGVVQAPFFDLRDPAAQSAWDTERLSPAPWAEIAGHHLILTVPSVAIRALEDPARLARFWDRVVLAHRRLGARPPPDRPERIVADVQISAGYMHSGYPIMTWLDVTRPSEGRALGLTLDVERLEKSGSWGHFHELGHNSQRPDWTFAGTVEVTCNLFTLHAMDVVVGLDPWEVDWLAPQRKKAAAYFEKGAPLAEWQGDPGLALLMYAQVQHEHGWAPFYAVFAEYEALPDSERPRDDDAKRDQWLVRLSRAAGRDLGPFFERWGVPVSQEARAEVAGLEAWMPDFGALR